MYDYEQVKHEVTHKSLTAVTIAISKHNDITLGDVISECTKILGACDSWVIMASVDRLVELGFVCCINPDQRPTQSKKYRLVK